MILNRTREVEAFVQKVSYDLWSLKTISINENYLLKNILFLEIIANFQLEMSSSSPNIFTVQEMHEGPIQPKSTTNCKNENLVHHASHQRAKRYIKQDKKLRSMRIMKKSQTYNGSHTDGFYGLLTQFILILSPLSLFLIPYNNAITNPEYWYEIIFSTLSLHFFLASSSAINFEILMGDVIKKTRSRIFLELFMFLKITEIVVTSIAHLIWSKILGYFEPLPLRLNLIAYVSVIAFSARGYFIVPSEMRKDAVTRKRLRAFIFGGLWRMIVTTQLNVIMEAFHKISKDLHWVIALVLIVTKEINDRIICFTFAKAALPDNSMEAKLVGKITINSMYSFCTALALCTIGTKATEFLLLSINFAINLALCYKAIKLNRSASVVDFGAIEKKNKEKDILTELVLNEIVEVVVPIALLGSFLIAYYGPNKNILGIVGCNIWQFKKVNNLNEFLIPVMEMALIDLGSAIIAAVSLWWFCRISLWREYCSVIKKYWFYLSLRGGVFMNAVSFISVLMKLIVHKHFIDMVIPVLLFQ